MHVVLILNPTSGISTVAAPHLSPEETREAILAALRAHDIEPEIRYTSPEDTGQGVARQAATNHADMVIAVGGDGTIHAVASGLVGTPSVLGIIPTGTMNNVAHSLGIPETIDAACEVIARGHTHAIDVGKINEHIFLEAAGIGLEAALFPAGEEIKSPGLLTTIRGVIGGLRTLFSFQSPELRIAIDEKRRHPYKALQVTICNTPFYGPHFQIASHILMDDGLLDVVIYKNFSKLEYIRHAVSITQGKRLLEPKARHRRARSVRITADHPVEIQADGVPRGYTPATVTIMPGALHVCVPASPVPGLSNEQQHLIESRARVASRRKEPLATRSDSHGR